jgi:hypothetical protein
MPPIGAVRGLFVVGTAQSDEPDPDFAGLRAEAETVNRPPFETVMRRARRFARRRSALVLLLLVLAALAVLALVP